MHWIHHSLVLPQYNVYIQQIIPLWGAGSRLSFYLKSFKQGRKYFWNLYCHGIKLIVVKVHPPWIDWDRSRDAISWKRHSSLEAMRTRQHGYLLAVDIHMAFNFIVTSLLVCVFGCFSCHMTRKVSIFFFSWYSISMSSIPRPLSLLCREDHLLNTEITMYRHAQVFIWW